MVTGGVQGMIGSQYFSQALHSKDAEALHSKDDGKWSGRGHTETHLCMRKANGLSKELPGQELCICKGSLERGSTSGNYEVSNTIVEHRHVKVCIL